MELSGEIPPPPPPPTSAAATNEGGTEQVTSESVTENNSAKKRETVMPAIFQSAADLSKSEPNTQGKKAVVIECTGYKLDM